MDDDGYRIQIIEQMGVKLKKIENLKSEVYGMRGYLQSHEIDFLSSDCLSGFHDSCVPIHCQCPCHKSGSEGKEHNPSPKRRAE